MELAGVKNSYPTWLALVNGKDEHQRCPIPGGLILTQLLVPSKTWVRGSTTWSQVRRWVFSSGYLRKASGQRPRFVQSRIWGCGSKLNNWGKPQVLVPMFTLTDRASHFGIPVF